MRQVQGRAPQRTRAGNLLQSKAQTAPGLTLLNSAEGGPAYSLI